MKKTETKSTVLLAHHLKSLRLPTILSECGKVAAQCAADNVDHLAFLLQFCELELLDRDRRASDRRLKAARFPNYKTLDTFDFKAQPSINRVLVTELMRGEYIDKKENLLLVGNSGTGKSHIAQALGHALIRSGYTVFYRSIFDAVRDLLHDEAFDGHDRIMARYLKPDVLILDDMGMKQLPKRSGEYLFEIIMRRHELRSTVMTSNRPLEDCGKLIGDVPAATAILDRFLQQAEVIEIKGRSYRLRNGGRPAETTAPDASSDSKAETSKSKR